MGPTWGPSGADRTQVGPRWHHELCYLDVSPNDSDKGTVFTWCCHPQPMPKWPLDSSSTLPNTTDDFIDATLWHSYVPRYRLLRQPTTTQSNNELKNSRWNIGWHDCHFVLKLQFKHNDSTQLNVFDTNVTHCPLEQVEKPALLRNKLIGAGQNRRWTVKFCKGVGGVFENCRGHSDENDIDFYRLWGKTDSLVGRFHTIDEQCRLPKFDMLCIVQHFLINKHIQITVAHNVGIVHVFMDIILCSYLSIYMALSFFMFYTSFIN